MVEDLLGLSFEHFCTCVVLPQGEFAALLHAEPRKRQDMLLALLDLGLYEAMGQAARSRATAAGAQVEVLEGQLGSLADASEEVLKEAERRVGVLDRLVERIDEARPRLDELTSVITVAAPSGTSRPTGWPTLTGLAVPDEVSRLAAKVVEAQRRAGAGPAGTTTPPRASSSRPRRRRPTSPTGSPCGSASPSWPSGPSRRSGLETGETMEVERNGVLPPRSPCARRPTPPTPRPS